MAVAKLVILGNPFILVLRAAVVLAKLLVLGVLFLTPFNLALRLVFAKLVISGILSSNFW